MAKPAPKIIPVSLPVDDVRLSAASMSRLQARRLLTGYWRAQKGRIGNAEATRGISHPLLDFFNKSFRRMETQMRRAMEIYVDQTIPGRWAIATPGIGPLIASSLIAYIDINKCGDNPQKLWRYAGLDPTASWNTYAEIDPQLAATKLLYGRNLTDKHINWLCKRFNKKYEILTKRAVKYGHGELTWKSLRSSLATRPWNKDFKTVCYFLGKGIRLKNNTPNFLYGDLYRKRKDYEYAQNAALGYEEQALKIYRETPWIDTSEESVCATYRRGMLPGFHIEHRARKWVTKIFLVHFHQVLYYDKYKEMPQKPYIIRAGSGHGEILCPNWPYTIVKKE